GPVCPLVFPSVYRVSPCAGFLTSRFENFPQFPPLRRTLPSPCRAPLLQQKRPAKTKLLNSAAPAASGRTPPAAGNKTCCPAPPRGRPAGSPTACGGSASPSGG